MIPPTGTSAGLQNLAPGPTACGAPPLTRSSLATLQVEAEELGRPYLTEALRRVGLLNELWECLAEEAPRAAQEVLSFSTLALERLSGLTNDVEAEQASDWVLQESTARWGSYLGLLDPTETYLADLDSRDRNEVGALDRDEDAAAIDPGTLLRMLTGDGGQPFDPSTNRGPRASASPADKPARAGLEDSELEVQAHFSPLVSPTSLTKVGPSPGAEVNGSIAVPPSPSSLNIDPELRDIFLDEASDLFDRIETLVLSFGRGQRQADILLELGRCFHTLKGAAGSVGLAQLAALVHSMEDRLVLVNGEATSGLIDALHEFLDYLDGVFIALRRGGTSAAAPESETRAAATTAAHSPSNAPPSPPHVATSAPRGSSPHVYPPAPVNVASLVKEPVAASLPQGAAGEGPVRVSSERIDELMDLVSELITRRGLWAQQAETLKELATMARTCRARMMSTIDKLRDLRPSHESIGNRAPGRGIFDRRADVPEMIRRLAEQSEDLVVLTENTQASAEPMADNSDALARLTLKLWDLLQAIRIVPVRGLFQRLARVAHDAARVEGRSVEIVMIGEETGLDRAVQEKAFEPLLHVVRNAVCHGIEPPSDRNRLGKPTKGRVTLEAVRAGNTLVLSVQDDGKGLDYDAIAAKGRRHGLLEPGEAASIDRLSSLIFQAGFSTRDEATAIAGRGVGMDVVSQEVGRLHGTIGLTSAQGQGVKLSVSLPARLALEKAMLIRIEGQAFALPVALIELAQPFEPADIEWADTPPRLRIREQWAPVVAARDALGFPPAAIASCPKLLLIRADGELLALLVDAIEGTRELVIKPLEPLLSGNPVVSGKSLSVTGEVIFALNPSGLARWLREVGGSGGLSAEPADTPRSASILVVDDSISVRKVVVRNLRSLGYDVEEVSDGLEALGKLRTHSFGMVFSDLEMPRMDGFELLAELSRLAISSTMPVVLASTRSDPETRRRVLELGARAFIPKPIDPDTLATTVRSLLCGHQPEAGESPRACPQPEAVQ
jgi:chemotaxis protein histidine kinase CheA/CheY-like chemotaxis protein